MRATGSGLWERLSPFLLTSGRYRELITLSFLASPRLTVGLAVVVVLQALAPIAFILASGLLVGRVAQGLDDGLDSADGRFAVTALTVMAVAFIVQQVLPGLQSATAEALGRRLDVGLGRRLMVAALAPHRLERLEEPALRDAVAAAHGVYGGWPRPGQAVGNLAGRMRTQLSMLGAGALLLAFHWWAPLVLLVPVLWLQQHTTTALFRLAQAQGGVIAGLRRAAYLRDLALTRPAAKEIRVFGLGNWLGSSYTESWQAAMRDSGQAGREDRRGLWTAIAATGAAVTLLFVLIAYEAARGELGIVGVAVFVQALVAVVRPIAEESAVTDALFLAMTIGTLDTIRAAEVRLAELPDEEVERQAGRAAYAEPAGCEIRIEDVHFRYPGQEREVLRGVDLTIPAKQSLALVGLNGAGKTTLIKLLCGLYAPTSGRILVGGVDLRDVDPTAWTRSVAAIFQDFVRYPFSAADNIAVGAPPSRRDVADVRAAAGRAGVDGALEQLPLGYDTVLSKSYEGGVDLSGGQWQRVALARALLAARAGARVLVLDEPAASLDVRAEAALHDQFLALTEGLTTLVISHRLSTVRNAQTICVLADGRICEQGDHTSLLASGGRYEELFRMQAARFVEDEQQASAAMAEEAR
jgi:ATP-binding cassette subfamily B protein